MAKGLFASPKKALLFVGMTMFSVLMLVGTEDDQGALVQATTGTDTGEPEFAPRRNLEFDRPERRDSSWGNSNASGFTPDEELINPAEGFDPTPEAVEPFQPSANTGANEARDLRADGGDGAGNQQ